MYASRKASRARSSQPSGAGDPAQQLGGRRGVRERAQHAGDVAQRRALAPALEQRAGGLALEVEDHPAGVAQHRLAEMEVAVVADQPPADADVRHQLQAIAHLLAAADDRRQRGVVGRQVEEDALDLLVDRRRQQRQRLGARLLRRRTPGRSCRRPARCASRRSRRRARRSARARALRVVERELPAVARRRRRSPGRCPSVASHELAGVARTSRSARRCSRSRASTGSAAARARG